MEKKTCLDGDRLLKELVQLREMNPNDAVEVVKGYHEMIRREIATCTESINKITELSPATTRITKTAIIIAEDDFTSTEDEDGLNTLLMLGSRDELFKLFKSIFKQSPKLLEMLAEDAGYKK